jgi:uncharacterized membrane protein YdjX (TVP38/TMEM64 family)
MGRLDRVEGVMAVQDDVGAGEKRPGWMGILPILLLAVTLVVMIVPMVFGEQILGISGKAGVAELLAAFAHSPWAPLAVVAVYTLLGLTGFPQFVLIGATVAIFGPWQGALYSWGATMVSANVGFWIGRLSGGRVLRRYGGERIHRASELLGRRGILASALVRVLPSGPFIMVNLVAGVSHMTQARFLIGTGIGIIPKTALIAFVGDKFISFLHERDPVEFALAGGMLALWVLIGLWVKRRFFRAHPPAPAAVRVDPQAEAQPADTGL